MKQLGVTSAVHGGGKRRAGHSGVAKFAVPAMRSFKKPCPHCQNLRGASLFGRVSVIWSQEERINTMSELATALYDEEVLHADEVPDAALELAGSKLWEGPAASFTVSFCSGLDTCPSSPRS